MITSLVQMTATRASVVFVILCLPLASSTHSRRPASHDIRDFIPLKVRSNVHLLEGDLHQLDGDLHQLASIKSLDAESWFSSSSPKCNGACTLEDAVNAASKKNAKTASGSWEWTRPAYDDINDRKDAVGHPQACKPVPAY